MSEKREKSEEREDSAKRQHVGTTTSSASPSQEYNPEEFSPQTPSSAKSSARASSSHAYNPEEFNPLSQSLSPTSSSSLQACYTGEFKPLTSSPKSPSDSESQAYDPERHVPVIPTSAHTSNASESQEYNPLFNETVAEIMQFRDTLSPPTHLPAAIIGITMDDYNYLSQRHPFAYSVVDNLGTGAFGSVVKAGIVVHNGFVAIKVYRMGGAVSVERLTAEVTLIRRLREIPHINILRCFAFFKHPQNDTYFLVTEYTPLGDLYTALQIPNAAGNSVWLPLDEAPIRHLSRGIAEGLSHLHVNGIAHGDLKLENVLIFWKKNTTQQQRLTPVTNVVSDCQRFVYQWIPKLADFSNSLTHKPTDPPGEIWHNMPRCTISYASPESWSSTAGVLPHYEALKADSYSLGCCILALALCAHPFKPEHHIGIVWPQQANNPFANIMQLRYIRICKAMKRSHTYLQNICRHFSDPIKRVVFRLLDTNPNTRLNVNQFLTDQWITRQHSYDSNEYVKPVRRTRSHQY